MGLQRKDLFLWPFGVRRTRGIRLRILGAPKKGPVSSALWGKKNQGDKAPYIMGSKEGTWYPASLGKKTQGDKTSCTRGYDSHGGAMTHIQREQE